jgi:hypothetical protein
MTLLEKAYKLFPQGEEYYHVPQEGRVLFYFAIPAHRPVFEVGLYMPGDIHPYQDHEPSTPKEKQLLEQGKDFALKLAGIID